MSAALITKAVESGNAKVLGARVASEHTAKYTATEPDRMLRVAETDDVVARQTREAWLRRRETEKREEEEALRRYCEVAEREMHEEYIRQEDMGDPDYHRNV